MIRTNPSARSILSNFRCNISYEYRKLIDFESVAESIDRLIEVRQQESYWGVIGSMFGLKPNGVDIYLFALNDGRIVYVFKFRDVIVTLWHYQK